MSTQIKGNDTSTFGGNVDLGVNNLTQNGLTGYTAKAWVNFNGTGTVAIRESGNVSSVTDNSTGDYTINFTTALTDANYSLNVTTSNASSGAAGSGPVSLFITNGTNTRVAPTTSAARFLTFSYNGGSLIDCEYVLCSVVR